MTYSSMPLVSELNSSISREKEEKSAAVRKPSQRLIAYLGTRWLAPAGNGGFGGGLGPAVQSWSKENKFSLAAEVRAESTLS